MSASASGYGGAGGISSSNRQGVNPWAINPFSVVTGSPRRQGTIYGPMARSDSSQAAPLPILYGTAKLPVLQIERYEPSSLPTIAWGAATVYAIGQFTVGSDSSVWYCWAAGTGGSIQPHLPGPYFLENGGGNAKWSLVYDTTALTYPLWGESAVYVKYDRVWCGKSVGASSKARCYECTIGGTSDSTGGPEGTGAAIVDNTVTWKYIGEWPQPSYVHAVCLAICEGELQGIKKIWIGKDLLEPESETGNLGRGLNLATGASPQTISTTFDESGYPNTALLYGDSFYSGTEQELPEIAVEATTLPSGWDKNPADIIDEMLTAGNTGVSWGGSYTPDTSATGYDRYCEQCVLDMSYVLDSQAPIIDAIRDILGMTCSDAVYSNGVLKIVPLTDQDTGTFVASNTAVYDLGPDDFITDSDPVRSTRRASEDCYQIWPVSYIDRDNGEYSQVTVEDPYMPSIVDGDGVGLRAGVLSSGVIASTGNIAIRCSRVMAQRSIHIRNEFSFKLSWRYSLLEPTDIVTITDQGLGLDQYPVRVLRIDETEDGFDITAEDYPGGASHAETYTPQVGDGYAPREVKTIAALPSVINGAGISIEPNFITPAHMYSGVWESGLLPNGNFNATSYPYDAGDVPPDEWTPYYNDQTYGYAEDTYRVWNNGVSLATAEADTISGGSSLQFDEIDFASGLGGTVANYGAITGYIPVVEGIVYTLTADLKKHGTPGTLRIIAYYFDVDFGDLGSQTDSFDLPGSQDVWENDVASFSAATGAGVRWLRIGLYVLAADVGSGEYINVDNVKLGLRQDIDPDYVQGDVGNFGQTIVSKTLNYQTTSALSVISSDDPSNTADDYFRIDDSGNVSLPTGVTVGGVITTDGAQGLLDTVRLNCNNLMKFTPCAGSSGGKEWWLSSTQSYGGDAGKIGDNGNYYFWNQTNTRIEAGIRSSDGSIFGRAFTGDAVLRSNAGWLEPGIITDDGSVAAIAGDTTITGDATITQAGATDYTLVNINGGAGAGGGAGLIFKRNTIPIGQLVNYNGNAFLDYQGDLFIRYGYGGTNALTLTSAGEAQFAQHLNYDFVGTNGSGELIDSNPMTTLGDMIYGGASGVPTRHAGLTSDGLYALTQTVSGSAAQAPVWGTVTTTGAADSLVKTNGSGSINATANTTSEQLRIGSLILQSYAAADNAWMGDNWYFDGSNYRRRAAGYSDRVYSSSAGLYQQVGGTGAAESIITPVTTYEINRTSGNMKFYQGLNWNAGTASQVLALDGSKNFTNLPHSQTGGASSLVQTNGALTASRALSTNSSGNLASMDAAVTDALAHATEVELAAGNTWYDSGLSITLPTAGTWAVSAKLHFQDQTASSPNAPITMRIMDTEGTPTTYSLCDGVIGYTASAIDITLSVSEIITTPGARTLEAHGATEYTGGDIFITGYSSYSTSLSGVAVNSTISAHRLY